MNNSDLAPICFFCYRRPAHTLKVLESIRKNDLSRESVLYVFIDKEKKPGDEPLVSRVKEVVLSEKWCGNIYIVERDKNFGLAKNIIDGINFVLKKHKKVIVLEDDIEVASNFLLFMNQALNFYESNKKVWHVSGWNYDLKLRRQSTFFWRVMNCWGWATWKDRWESFSKEPTLALDILSEDDRALFNLDGYVNFYKQLEANARGEINTWAIYWYLTIFVNKGLCLNPYISLVKNIGLDGTGENSIVEKNKNKFNFVISNKWGFPTEMTENTYMVKLIKNRLRPRGNICKRTLRRIIRSFRSK